MAELVSDPDFNDPTMWVITDGQNVEISDGLLKWAEPFGSAATGSVEPLDQISPVIGAPYVYEITITPNINPLPGTSLEVWFGGVFLLQATDPGTFTREIIAETGEGLVIKVTSSFFLLHLEFDRISIKLGQSDSALEIKSRLNKEWPLVEPNIPWYTWEQVEPNIGADLEQMFMVVEFPGGRGKQASIGAPGNNWWKEKGVFNLHIYYPAGDTADAARAALENAATIFRDVSEDGMIYRAPFLPQPGQEGTLSGNWMSLSMSIPYEYRIRA